MDTPPHNWPPFDLELPPAAYELDGGAHPRTPVLPSYNSLEFRRNGTLDSTPRSTPTSIQALPSGIVDAFRVIYQYLHEKHYIDRMVHALYLHPDRHNSASKILGPNGDNSSRTIFANIVRASFPQPSQFQSTLAQARGNTQDPPLVSFLLSQPVLRFRICAAAHLFEAVLAIPTGTWGGEHPRQLSSDEVSYVMEKLQDIFRDSFSQPSAQNCLIRELSALRKWSEMSIAVGEEDGDEQNLSEIIKTTFPCIDAVIQEYRNLLEAGRNDEALNSEVAALLGFVERSLKLRIFVEAPQWTSEGRVIFENLQKTLGARKYYGPAQRLIRNIVSMTYQLWDGGRTTDTSLAIERILVNVQKSPHSSDVMAGHRTATKGNGGWNLMDGFEKMVRAASSHVVPIPLPSIVWRQKSLEIYLDSMVVHLPRLMPRNIHLDSTMEFDKHTDKLCRRWRLKISGLEAEAKAIPFYLVAKTPLNKHLFDVGELSFSIPANSLDIEVDFNLLTPEKGSTEFQHQSQDHHEGVHSDTSTQLHPNGKATNGTLPNGSWKGVSNGKSDRAHANGSTKETSQFEDRHPDTVNDDPRINWDTRREANNDGGSTAKIPGWNSMSTRATWGSPRHQIPPQNGESPTQGSNKGELKPTQGRKNKRRLILTHPRTNEAVHRKGFAVKKLVDVKEFRVHLRKLDVTIHSTKYPMLHSLVHLILVRQMRMALEQTLKQTIVDMVNAINISADGITGLTEEELRSRHKDNSVPISERPVAPHQQQTSQFEFAEATGGYSSIP
ncbi:hypothetical protein BGX21_007981 [Mortierella sp. AD011]|nr:hypothetical protein BGX21_007981 [Mortierella sp. AD011]